jgi:glycerol-3-phosphate dehydrogenase (NAD(P)+)
MNIAMLGAGAWGTALAVHLAPRHALRLWTRSAEHAARLGAERSNARYLPGVALPASITPVADLARAVTDADLVILAVPSAALRATLDALAGLPVAGLIWLTKGFEPGSHKLPHQVVAECLSADIPHGALTGPSFAQEVASGLPTAVTLASRDAAFAQWVARTLRDRTLRIYTSDDVVGVEVAGALKNVIALAAGICDGLQLGYNARAALMTRGLAEIARLGQALGGRADTFMGLSGMGDLFLTASGELSRNRAVGLKLAAGEPLAAILDDLGHVAEGVPTAPEALALAAEHGVQLPITAAVHAVLQGRLTPRAAVETLLAREPGAES